MRDLLANQAKAASLTMIEFMPEPAPSMAHLRDTNAGD
jgi:hypothetical protein